MPKLSKKYGVPDAENPEWTSDRLARSMNFDQLPLSLQQKLSAIQNKRGPQKKPTKVLTSIRLSPDVLDALRATGEGWQSRADEALRAFVNRQAKQSSARKAARKAA